MGMDAWPAAARQNAQLAFSIILPFVCVYMGTVLVTFYRRREMMPLRARPLKNVLASQILLGIYLVELALTWVARDGHPCVFVLMFGFMTLMPCMNLYMIRVWMLWFAYKTTQQKRDLCSDVNLIRNASVLRLSCQLTNSNVASNGEAQTDKDDVSSKSDTQSSDSDTVPPKRGIEAQPSVSPEGAANVLTSQTTLSLKSSMWYLRNKRYGQDSFIYKVFIVKTGIEELVLISPMLLQSGIYSETLGPGVLSLECPSQAWLAGFFMAVVVINALLMFGAAVKFGEVVDGFYLKTEFKLNAMVALFGMIVWNAIHFAYNPSPEFPFSTLVMHVIVLSIFTATTVYPMWKTRMGGGKSEKPRPRVRKSSHSRMQSQTVSVSTNSHEAQLGALLSTKRGLKLFREHLTKEFSIENLIFWEAVNDFRASFVPEDPAMNQAHAEEIFHRFIEEDSPLQVNIDYLLVVSLKKTIFSSDVHQSPKESPDSPHGTLRLTLPTSPTSQLSPPTSPVSQLSPLPLTGSHLSPLTLPMGQLSPLTPPKSQLSLSPPTSPKSLLSVPGLSDDLPHISEFLFDKTQTVIHQLMASDSFLRLKESMVKAGKEGELDSLLRAGSGAGDGGRKYSLSKSTVKRTVRRMSVSVSRTLQRAFKQV